MNQTRPYRKRREGVNPFKFYDNSRKLKNSVADPGFEKGAKNFFEILPLVWVKWVNIGQEAIAFLIAKYAFSYFFWYLSFKNFTLHLYRYITKYL